MYQNSVLNPSGQAGLGQQLLGLVRVVLDLGQVRIAAQDRRRLEALGQDVALGVKGVDQGLAVDGVGDRPAHLRACQRARVHCWKAM